MQANSMEARQPKRTTIGLAAARVGLNYDIVRGLVDAGFIGCVRVPGGRIQVDPAEVEAVISAATCPATRRLAN